MAQSRRITAAVAGLGFLLAVAVTACGDTAASPAGGVATNPSPAGPEAANGEAVPTAYVDSVHHYRIDAPGRVAPNPDGSAGYVGPSERMQIRVVQGPAAADPSALAAADLAALPSSVSNFHLVGGPATGTLSGRTVVKAIYTFNAGSSPVTGKPLDMVGVLYYVPRDASTVAVIAYGIVTNQYDPQGADDIASTFQWQ